MKSLLEQLLNKEDLSSEIAFQTMYEIMSGNYTDIEISGFLIALRSKGESINEITGFAKAMREKMIPVNLTKPAIAMCGTGGDSSVELQEQAIEAELIFPGEGAQKARGTASLRAQLW